MPVFRRRFATIASLAVLAAATLLPGGATRSLAAAASYGPSSMVLSEFDKAGEWLSGSSSGTLTTVTSPKTSGSGALKIDYNLTNATSVSIQQFGTPPELPGLARHVSLDVYGDGSWNVVYFEIRDATGEILRYWVGNISFTGWQTMSVDIGSAVPVSGLDGNADKVLDLPGSFSQLVIYKNNGAKALVSTIYVDRLTYEYDPNGATADTPIFVPSAGGSSVVRVSLADQGQFNLRLTDEAGRYRTFAGTAGNGSDWSATWDGLDDAGNMMTGSVRGSLIVARSTKAIYQLPYFAGLPARPAGSNPALRGVNSFLTEIDTASRAKAEQEARLMESDYLGMAREEFEWKRVEPVQSDFEWAKFDQAVAIESAHGIGILGKLVYGSPWDNSAPKGTPLATALMYPPSDIYPFVDYAVATVHRYKDKVHYWEIWNEENQSGFWKPQPNAAQYTQVLMATYRAIKAEDPTATVVLGGLSTGPDSTFLKGIKDAGGWDYFDVLAIHSYVTGKPDGSAYERWITDAKNIVASYGSKPIWITEYGWSSYSGGTTTANQSAYLMRSYEIAAAAGVAGNFWFEFVNRGANTSDVYQNWGILNSDLSPKPAYSGFGCEAQAIYAGGLPNCSGSAPPTPPAPPAPTPPSPPAPTDPPTPSTYPDSTFTGLKPTRLLDTRIGLGLSGAFTAGTPRTFKVAGDLGGSLGTVVPSTAIAVTGNLTVTAETARGYVFLGPQATSTPGSSTINFPAMDNRANGVTVPLASDGSLSAVYIAPGGATVHVVFDVTGYFDPGTNGAFYVAVPPVRLLDSRIGNGLSGEFVSKVPRTFAVAGRQDASGNVVVPADALAVTGNLTITGQTTNGYAYIGPDSTGNPTSSSVNAPALDNRANNVVVALDSTGSLSVVFVGPNGSKAHLVFDVTGYFTKSGGWTYVPATPTRLLDSRSGNGASGVFTSHVPRGFGVIDRGPVPHGALAVTGNLTVTSQTAKGFGFAAPSTTANPGSSTINFPVGDNRANGVSLQLSSTGTLSIVYVAGGGATTHFIFDVTGYYH
jgi:hypothetical protein